MFIDVNVHIYEQMFMYVNVNEGFELYRQVFDRDTSVSIDGASEEPLPEGDS